MKSDPSRLFVRTSLAILVVLAGIGFALAPAAAGGVAETTDETADDVEELLKDAGTEVCYTLFNGPHLPPACESTVHDAIEETTP